MEDSVNFKEKYQEMKKKLKFLVYEQECFLEELKKSQKKLLKLDRDKSFLLDELMQYEIDDAGASDSEATESSESDHAQPKEPKKRKIMNLPHKVATTSHTSKILKTQKRKLHVNKTQASSENSASASKASPRTTAPKQEAHVMREEIERQLEMKHSSKPDFMNINFTSHHPPEDIFNNDSSNQDCSEAVMLVQTEDDSDLIIDMA